MNWEHDKAIGLSSVFNHENGDELRRIPQIQIMIKSRIVQDECQMSNTSAKIELESRKENDLNKN
jgi:hypothetical protein